MYNMAKQRVVEKLPIRAKTTIGQLLGYTSRGMNRVHRNMQPASFMYRVSHNLAIENYKSYSGKDNRILS